ncbi:MAG TPA: TIGR04282 family arsenosugar biosynthesis glycosyltransferase [Chitinophagales bacterium]|nr:TIGR04282 family arsenosugar biosynthesis glycosyltransferase [Chitinophagales bacterium]
MTPELLMIFVKNPVEGKVKTRIAKTMGPEKALEIYLLLLEHTHHVSKNLAVDKAVFYSDEITTGDVWDSGKFQKYKQEGSDLGKRMLNAFKFAFGKNYRKVVVIGSDCFDLTPKIIKQAFAALPQNNFVIGPTHDGGYYLLGMTALHTTLFKNKRWSSEDIFQDTLIDIRNMNGSYKLLPELTDIDTEEDLIASKYSFSK